MRVQVACAHSHPATRENSLRDRSGTGFHPRPRPQPPRHVGVSQQETTRSIPLGSTMPSRYSRGSSQLFARHLRARARQGPTRDPLRAGVRMIASWLRASSAREARVALADEVAEHASRRNSDGRSAWLSCGRWSALAIRRAMLGTSSILHRCLTYLAFCIYLAGPRRPRRRFRCSSSPSRTWSVHWSAGRFSRSGSGDRFGRPPALSSAPPSASRSGELSCVESLTRREVP
jgi:hypothetical protein